MSSSLSRKHLNIGVYYLNDAARTEKHIQELAQCGVDFVVYIDSDRPMLDLLAKYGIGAIVNDVLPHWWGGNGENAGLLSQQNPIEVYHSAADTFIDHPAIWGISIGDEPSALDFPYYGKIYQRVQTLFPGKIPFLNLYPN